MGPGSEKDALRSFYLKRRKSIPLAERRDFDRAIADHVRTLPEFRSLPALAAFVAFGAEPDLSSLFPEKRLYLPRFSAETKEYEFVRIDDPAEQLRPGKFGIPEPPADLPAADWTLIGREALILVPAVACDPFGTRLGRGGGFYDRLLDKAGGAAAAAVIYHCQLAEKLPREIHDRPMDRVVTEQQIIHCPCK